MREPTGLIEQSAQILFTPQSYLDVDGKIHFGEFLSMRGGVPGMLIGIQDCLHKKDTIHQE